MFYLPLLPQIYYILGFCGSRMWAEFGSTILLQTVLTGVTRNTQDAYAGSEKPRQLHGHDCAPWQGWLEGWAQLGLLTGASNMVFPTWQSQRGHTSTMAAGFPQSTYPRELDRSCLGFGPFLIKPWKLCSVTSTVFYWLQVRHSLSRF